jgi:hypothetical protein
MLLVLWTWRLTWKIEKDTREMAVTRHKLGKETSKIYQEDGEFGTKKRS